MASRSLRFARHPRSLLLTALLLAGACADAPDASSSDQPSGDSSRPDAGRSRADAGSKASDAAKPAAIPDAKPSADSPRDGGSTANAPSSSSTPPADAGRDRDAGARTVTNQDAASADAGSAPESCSDSCAKSGGLDWLCKLRFAYGLNYAWSSYGGDFGGIAAWDQKGVSQNPKVAEDLATFHANGVSVLRWWVFPSFRGEGVQLDESGDVIGLGGTALADLARALELAEQNDLYLMLTLFSFDSFYPDEQLEGGVRARGISKLAIDDARRAKLIENVVRPFARAASQSPHKDRLISWDVINEPEWAIRGASLYGGDPQFDTNMKITEPLTHAQMEKFIGSVVAALRDESEALISVGSAAIKWRHAWSKIDVDYHQFHTYDWVNEFWPYDKSPGDYMIDNLPVVMGEFPLGGLQAASYAELTESWYQNGYAGALGWSYSDFKGSLAPVKAFADRHPCETKY
jgi:hypothetical protein